MRRRFFFLLGICALHLTACADRRQAEFYGDIFATEDGFSLTKTEHPTGWGQRQCFLCHFPNNIHQVDNSETLDLDMEEIQKTVEEKGLESCSVCHGNNGVNP